MAAIQCIAHGRMIGRHKLEQLGKREGFEIAWTSGPRQMEQMAQTAIDSGCQRLLVAGGDGSLQEAAQALAGSGTAMAVIPGGTGNDFARSVGVDADLEAAVRTALTGEIRAVDVGLASTADTEGAHQPTGSTERWFVNIAEVGFGAGVVGHMNHFARYAGKGLAYPIGILTGVLWLKHHHVRCLVDGEEMEFKRLVNLVIANGRYFGRGMKPAPDAQLDDGFFDVLAIQNLGRLAIARRFPELKQGPPPNDPDMQTFRCRRIEILSEAIATEADGEVLGNTPAIFEIHAGKLDVVFPAAVSS